MNKSKIGIIGCGVISEIYIKNLSEMFDNVEVVAVADVSEAARNLRKEQFNIKKSYTTEEMLRDEEVEIVVNLTTPKLHFDITMAALNAGKHVYSEKTLALTVKDAQEILQLAAKKNLLVGCAPDTILGAGIQTCKQWIDEGKLGVPTMILGVMVSGGPESWHPNPAFLYDKGAGPLFDMGPYYVTAMVELLGKIHNVTGIAKKTFEQREITSEPLKGTMIDVGAPTNVAAVFEFEGGALGTLITSFDAHDYMPRLEVFGTGGTLIVPDPNYFDGPVKFKALGSDQFVDLPLVNPYTQNSRGLGISQMAEAIHTGCKLRASGETAAHVVEVLHRIYSAGTV